MDFYDVVRKRYSVRAYRKDPIPDDVLRRVLEAAVLAPTAANRQAFRLIVAHTEGREQELSRVYDRPWFVQGPVVIAAVGVPESAWVRRGDGKNYCDLDIGIVMEHLVLAATAEGLGTCWVAAFDPQAAREVLRLPPEAEPIAFTPLGYPATEGLQKGRKPFEELISYERW